MKLRQSLWIAGLAVAAPLAGVTPAVAAPIVINFDVDGLGNPIGFNVPITNQYANLGVTFLGLENGDPININAAPDPDGVPEPSNPNVLTNCANASAACPGNRADLVRITFDNPASAIRLMLDSLGGLSVTFNLYDSASNLLETQTVTSGGSLYVPVIFSATGVSRIEGLQPNDGWAWAMDDLQFESAAVPEPATLALVGLGLAAARARRRKA